MMIADCNHHHQQRAQQQVTTTSTTMLSSTTNTNQRASNAAPMRHQHQLSSPQSNSCHQELHQHNQHHMQQQQQHYGHHEAHQAPQVHYIEANNNSHHPQSQHNNHDQRQQHQQTSVYSPQQQHQIYTRPMGQQQQPQQIGQHLHLPASVNAPPTPPSDDQLQQTVYLAPQDSRQQQHSNKLQTGAWVMQTIQIQQQQQHHNELQDSAPVGQQPASTISSYYYDIDDGFSDILSAPATPEPVQIIDQIHNQQQPLNDNYQPGYTSNYISYNTDDSNQRQQRTVVGNNVQLDFENHHNHHNHHHHQQQHQHQQQQQQHFYRSQVQQCNRLTMAQVPYTVAMSPDSSSLSTTSSSPSDHSLYQASPPMAGCGLLRNNGLLQAAGPIQSVQQQQLKSHYPTHLLPLSPAANVKSPSNEQTFPPVSQPQQTINATTNPSQVILKPINNSMQTSARPLAQQPYPNQLHQHHHHRSSPIHLWEFLKELLQQVEAGSADSTIIRWLDRQRGVFKIEDSVRVAKLWGKRKNKPKMNYDKLSRSIRQYYKKGIMKKTDRSQRLVYQFCSAYCH